MKYRVHVILIGIMIVLGGVIYSNTLNSPFILDDEAFIFKNFPIQINDLSIKSLSDAAFKGAPRNRVIPKLSFAINYYIGGFDVFGYHVVNIAIHLMTGLCLFLLFNTTLGILNSGPNVLIKAKDLFFEVPFFAALIWLVHPVNTNAVAYLAQRMTSIVALFYVLSLFLYAKGRLGVNHKRMVAAMGYFAGSIVSGCCAVASKQNAGMLPIFILLYEWFFFQNLKNIFSGRKFLLFLAAAIIFAGIAIYFLGENPILRILNSYKHREFTLPQRVMTEWRVIIYYISLFFFPLPERLALDHVFPLSFSPVLPLTTIISLAAILLLIGLAVRTAKADRIMSFCILWFLGNLVIESSVIGIEIIFEHRNYLPFMFLCFFFVRSVYGHMRMKWAGNIILSLIVIVFSAWTYQRNAVWESTLSFYSDNAKKTPNLARLQNNLGLTLEKHGETDDAILHYQRAVSLDPKHFIAYYNLGNILANRGQIDLAVVYYLEALKYKSNYIEAHGNLGKAYFMKGEYDKAIYHFNKAMENINLPGMDDYKAKVFNNLGASYFHTGKINEAIANYREALRINPSYINGHYNIAEAYYHTGDYDQAVLHLKTVMRLKPDHVNARMRLQIALTAQESALHQSKNISGN